MTQIKAEGLNLQESVIHINRVAKVVKGGRRFSFTALVAVGDGESTVGVGYGKAKEVPLAIQKAIEDARKNLFVIPKHGTTITHEVIGHHGAGRVLLRPASAGTGVIAGGGVRALLELGGVRDVLTKSLGTTNPINMVRAAEKGLRALRRPEEVALQRGKTVREILGKTPLAGAASPGADSPADDSGTGESPAGSSGVGEPAAAEPAKIESATQETAMPESATVEPAAAGPAGAGE